MDPPPFCLLNLHLKTRQKKSHRFVGARTYKPTMAFLIERKFKEKEKG